MSDFDAQWMAEDLGFDFCALCQVAFMPMPGMINDGHQCFDDGTKDEYTIMPQLTIYTE